ncbi:TolC family protein [Pseudobdellovibrio exovorus]|uniref:HAS ABC exporter outer membrane component n=1 Tax=Pseudobdellovibrio exovorus JSS TaxID=1184267 RepID=M4V5T9_9BACT|nr:TolC family protein [Pseudobdellovibrio exovorus]AGH94727.1 HAS ABC exporter outer membrane component [Pseudobdellovibrio exovorus JSS]
MKIITLVISSLTLFGAYSHAASTGSAVEVNASNLRSLLESKSARISAASLEVEAARAYRGSFGRSFLPDVEIYGQQENFKKGQLDQKTQPAYGAQATLNLFNGGRDLLLSDQYDLQIQQKSYQFRRVQAEELEKARSLYWNILYSQQRISLLESTQQVNAQNLRAADRRIQSGVATDSDRVLFQMKGVELEQDLAQAKVQLTSDKRDLAIILGYDNEVDLSFPQALDHEHDFEKALEHSAADHEFLYKENALLSEVKGLEAKRQTRSWVPKLDAYAAYNQYNQRQEDPADAKDRTESVVGVKLTLSLQNLFNSQREARSLRQEALSASTLADLQRKEVENHISNEIASLRLLHDQVHAAEENISRAEKYYKLSQSEYARGVKNSPDVLGAAEKLYDIRNRHLEIIRDFQLAKSHVLSKIGK